MVKTIDTQMLQSKREKRKHNIQQVKKLYREKVSNKVLGWIKIVLELANINTEAQIQFKTTLSV